MVAPIPEPVRRVNAKDEANAAAEWLLEQRRAGSAWRDIAVLAPGKRNWRDPIAAALDAADIPYRMMLGDKSIDYDPGADRVHVMTMYAIEGLEFSAVAVVGIGDLPWKSQSLEEAAGLLTGALARTTRAAIVSYSKRSALVDRILAT